MKKTLQRFCILSLVAFIVMALVGCNSEITNTYSLEDVAVGDTFEITLAAHGGTAYRWDYKINKSGVEYATREFVPTDNDPEIMGGGDFVYTFKASKTGSYKIKFKLQVLNNTEPPIEINIYKITVVK